MSQQSQNQREAAIQALEKAEEIRKMMDTKGWEIFVDLIRSLEIQEFRALSGAKLDHTYYKRVGFLRVMKYVQELKDVVKDAQVREYLLHQGMAKAMEMVIELPQYFFKAENQARQALDKLGMTQPTREEINQHNERVYREG